VSDPAAALLESPKLSSAAPPKCVRRATIAFLESDRPDGPGAGDAYGDQAQARPREVLAANASAS
jgi:hypothetical protein